MGFFGWFSQLGMDSRQNEILIIFLSPLRSTIKLKTPAGEMPVQLLTSRCPMAVLVELHFSPEAHEQGVLTVDSSFTGKTQEDCLYKPARFRPQLVTKAYFGLHRHF